MRRPNLILLAIICVFVIVEILFLRPASVEVVEEDPQSMFTSIETMVEAQKEKDEVGYTIEGFHFTAVEGERKDWEMNAREAILYEKSRMVFAQDVRIRMFEPDGQVTNIESKSAYYRMGTKDLTLEKDVRVQFPDGFWLKTSRAHYKRSEDEVSSAEPFYGEAAPAKGEVLNIWGTGFKSRKSTPDIHILSQARVKVRRLASDEITELKSDLARIDRFSKVAYFSMVAGPAAAPRYVESNQGTLHVRSRRQEATYDPASHVLKYMTALEDVLIRETDVKKGVRGLKYATCQRADFLAQEDKILLSGFPSAYQENDTVTGDLITIYRKTNIVEVTQANAYHEGKQPD